MGWESELLENTTWLLECRVYLRVLQKFGDRQPVLMNTCQWRVRSYMKWNLKSNFKVIKAVYMKTAILWFFSIFADL
jgi:hypothetical protein